MCHVVQTLAYAFFRIRSSGNVEQALICFCVLHDGRCLSLDREHNRAFALLELLHEVAGTTAKSRQ
jgi:hypothetical protein